VSWVLDSTDAQSVFWRRVEDGYVIGFNRPGVGEPSSTEDAPPADIDRYAPAIAEPEPAAPRHITVYAFRARFTTDEKIAIEMAATDNPASSVQVRGFAARVRASEKDIASARHIDLNMDATREGVMALEMVGVIGAGRALQILDDPIQDHERA
jgi:hypothetical protein